MKQWNLGPCLSVLGSRTVLTTSEQASVDLGQHVDLIILLTGSWYKLQHVLTNICELKSKQKANDYQYLGSLLYQCKTVFIFN